MMLAAASPALVADVPVRGRIKGSGALDCAAEVARTRLDLLLKKKWTAPGARAGLDEALALLTKAERALLDATGPHVALAFTLLEQARAEL